MSKIESIIWNLQSDIPTLKRHWNKKLQSRWFNSAKHFFTVDLAGIMACEFGATVNENKIVDDLHKLKQLNLESEWENLAVNDLTLHRDFTKAQKEMNEEISIVIKNIAAKNNFLQMLSGIHFDDTDKFEELIRLFCDFTVVCFAIIKNLRTKESKIEYSYEAIEKEFIPYVKDNLLYFHLNCLSMQWLAMADDPFQHFSDDDFDFENLLKRNDIDDYFDELFGKQENLNVVTSKNQEQNISAYLCGYLFDIISNIKEVYEKLSDKFQYIEKFISNDTEELNKIIEDIANNPTKIDILLQYKKYYMAVKNLKNKAINNAIEKIVKKFFKNDLTEEMLLSLTWATREYQNLVSALKHEIKLIERGNRNEHKAFTLYNMDKCRRIDDISLEYFFESRKEDDEYKYLIFCTFDELFYIKVNEKDKESKPENALFFVEGERKNWRRDILERILPKIKMCLEKEIYTNCIQMSGSKIVRDKIGEDKITDGVIQIEEYVEKKENNDDLKVYSNQFQDDGRWFDTSSNYKLPSKHSNKD